MYLFEIQPCFKYPSPFDNFEDDTAIVFNRLLDIESQAFSERDGSFVGDDSSSITESLKNNHLRSSLDQEVSASPIYIHEQKKQIDMAVIERIKALRNLTSSVSHQKLVKKATRAHIIKKPAINIV